MSYNKIITSLRAQGMSVKEMSDALDVASDLVKAKLFTEGYKGFERSLGKLISDFESADLKCILPSSVLKIDPMSYCKKWGEISSYFSIVSSNFNNEEIKSLLSEVGINYNKYRRTTLPKEVGLFSLVGELLPTRGYILTWDAEDYFLTGKIGEWSSFSNPKSMFIYKDTLNWMQVWKDSFIVSQEGLIYKFKLSEFSNGAPLNKIKYTESEKEIFIANTDNYKDSGFIITEIDSMLIANEIGQVKIISDDENFENIDYELESTRNRVKGFVISLNSKNYCLMINPVPLSQSEKVYVCGLGYVNDELAYLSFDTADSDPNSVDFVFDESIDLCIRNQVFYASYVEPSGKIITVESKVKPRFGNFENKIIPSPSNSYMKKSCSDYVDKVIDDVFGVKSLKPEELGYDRLINSQSVSYVKISEFNRIVKAVLYGKNRT